MLCREVMKSEVETFRETDSVLAVALRMREVNIGFVPICDADGHPLGALTDRDIALRVCGEDRRASETRTGAVMTREIITCRESDPIEAAEELMARYRKSRMMIVDEDGRLVGVISLSDVVEEEDDRRAAETMRQISEREIHP
ncbi:CBS domain-containing protein [Anaeromyxobacter sp. Fw109-5]|jgi:CBS domain-containing protein|uniref:CBS domain-containing protein n=1 Tax=Anaeromyxobacter sp. (strain Fw109-5) TaxID=404589 RepID=UPI0000ED70AA|nr:CBS domain-containing protein [Anaeromyxobacter sp. Fw109-5]ABS27671.1 CBS domain containing protein [Anaeromyxobacter sp. Fw109-5]